MAIMKMMGIPTGGQGGGQNRTYLRTLRMHCKKDKLHRRMLLYRISRLHPGVHGDGKFPFGLACHTDCMKKPRPRRSRATPNQRS
ncbi:hypothetical protein MKW98_011261 [Papaver atlanticum]|uniref:Uncharacterized protein n=1 Tax=Papaver atlanticum TaxID=357466 RepID=A0AAD4SW11_9MAGN|nr:hypothetical protein MKW98_011261 [Papaver atlanticum]